MNEPWMNLELPVQIVSSWNFDMTCTRWLYGFFAKQEQRIFEIDCSESFHSAWNFVRAFCGRKMSYKVGYDWTRTTSGGTFLMHLIFATEWIFFRYSFNRTTSKKKNPFIVQRNPFVWSVLNIRCCQRLLWNLYPSVTGDRSGVVIY